MGIEGVALDGDGGFQGCPIADRKPGMATFLLENIALASTLAHMPSTSCWWCQRQAPMRLIEESITCWPDAVQACYRCAKCRALNLAEKNGISPRVRDESDARRHLAEGPLEWRPAGPKHYPGMPEEISMTASEAYACMSAQAHKAAILVARSVIEACAKDNGITRGRLLEKIDRMHAVALIRAHVRDAAHEIRHLGNDMAHGDFAMPVEEADARMTVLLMDDVLEEVYGSKARVNSRTASLRVRRNPEGPLAEQARQPEDQVPDI
jgi:hypothetical protein